ncbi:Parvalbumin [Trema orientale]|uniref:Parvalbumin n=1 Tax=Trema orientale TaxID=63057 RepID=A0A2P5E198_TREOI|nr:Parvalbumin [Trema orientale]
MVIQVQTPGNFSVKPVQYKKVQVQWTKEQLMNAFKSHDKDGDGKLSMKELKQAFKDLGSAFGFYRAKKALFLADTDNNGYIDITDKELEDLVDYAYDCGYKVPA